MTLLVFKATIAQTALIKDPDGYCNIRQSASSQSKVIDTLSNDRIVFIFEEEAKGNWFPVDYKKGKETLSGFIHKSRITFLSSLTKFNRNIFNDSILQLQVDSFQVNMIKGNFNPQNRKIKYNKSQGEQTFVKSIDDKFPWGTDGNVPKKEYKTVQFRDGKSIINFPVHIFKDLFEPNLDMTMAYQDKATGKFYIEAFNSDGAGGYLVIWTIKDRKILGRETFIPF